VNDYKLQVEIAKAMGMTTPIYERPTSAESALMMQAKMIVAALRTFERDLPSETDADAYLSARVAMALHPEHVSRPVALSPAERLAVVERLTGIDVRRAAVVRDENPEAYNAARAARAEMNRTVQEAIRLHGQIAWDADNAVAAVKESLRQEHLKARRLAAEIANPPTDLGFANGANVASLNNVLGDVQAQIAELQARHDSLTNTAKSARAEVQRLSASLA
jgi:hypothetical protein